MTLTKPARYNLDYWSPFVDFALRNGVGFAFENMFQSGHHERYCSQVEELIDLVDAFKDPRVGVCWDTGHASVAGQDQSAAIRMLGHRLKATHIHDNHGLPYGDEHLTPYFGSSPGRIFCRRLAKSAMMAISPLKSNTPRSRSRRSCAPTCSVSSMPWEEKWLPVQNPI